MANSQLTVIVIPQTGKRPFSFKFTPYWFALAGLLLSGAVYTISTLYQANSDLQDQLTELSELQMVNRLQQAEIEAMTIKAEETQSRLEQLYLLEQQIRDLTGVETARISRSSMGGDEVQILRGRGGPAVASSGTNNLPTLSTILPADVTAHIFAPRDTLPLHLKQIDTYERSDVTLAKAEGTHMLMEAQIESMENLAANLTDGKDAIVEQIEYLAHRPTGWPVYGASITDRFGWRWSPFGSGRQHHNGMDFGLPTWTPIYATGAGTVVHAGWRTGGYGNAVIIDHGYGFQTLYAHMVDWNVKPWQEVERGTLIGWVGSTGLSTGPHLHYEVHRYGVPVDPSNYLQ